MIEKREIVAFGCGAVCGTPKPGERAFCAVDRVGGGKGYVLHTIKGSSIGRRAADIPMFARWVGPDDEEVGAGLEFAVSGTGGQDCHVAGLDDEFVAALAAQDEAPPTARKTEDLVGRGVVVVEVVDAVA